MELFYEIEYKYGNDLLMNLLILTLILGAAIRIFNIHRIH